METFEKHRVAFVSVTQQFNTATSMGRLILNVLLSFAQFERELIAERTRDKVAATRRKGKWSGGRPLLGYDVDRSDRKLVRNQAEAVRVQAIFDWFLKHEALAPVVRELARRRWVHKRWTNRAGQICGGQPFTKVSLDRLLRNVAYVGQVRYQDEVHPGEHPALVSTEVFQRVQALLHRNGRNGATAVRRHSGALLKGLVRCVPCGCAMVPACTRRRNGHCYRYYVCAAAQKHGWEACPTKSVAAASIEQVVVAQLRSLGGDPEALSALVGQIAPGDQTPSAKDSSQYKCQDTDVEVATAVLACAGDWEALPAREQILLVQRLIERIDYDGAAGQLSVTFHARAIQGLAQAQVHRTQENQP
jgi:site-specific DNA recombinase